MQIKTNSNIPDSTYFRMSDVKPYYRTQDDTLVIFDGKGSRRGWGQPTVTSTVVFRGRALIAVHVGFSHKHGGGQGWHYFRFDGAAWTKISWSQLDDTDRKKVLARANHAPRWAKSPGKLKSERPTIAQTKRTAYKLVKVEDERYVSLYDGETEYIIGKRLSQPCRDDHNGGYYAYPTVEGVRTLWENKALVPEECLRDVSKVALLEVEIAGRIIAYKNKLAATYITPLREVETWTV